MQKDKPIIVDTNILFSALLNADSKFAEILLNPHYHFHACDLLYIELFSLKEKLVKYSRLEPHQVIELLSLFLKRIRFFKEEHIAQEHLQRAYELCKEIDKNDTQHVALTLELDGLLWTGDKKLVRGLKERGFNQFFELDHHSYSLE